VFAVAIVLVLSAMLALPGTALGTSLVPLSVEEMTAMAQTVAVVRVESEDVRPVPSPEGAAALESIATHVDLRVTQALKGEVGGTLELVLPGGSLGDTTFLATWSPRFRAGETAVIFLDAEGMPLSPEAKLTIEDGRVPALGQSLPELLARVLGEPPLGPFASSAPERVSFTAELPRAAVSGPDLGSASVITPAASTLLVDDGFESGAFDPGTWGHFDGGMGTTWTVTSERSSVATYSAYCDDDAPAGGPYTTDSYSWLYAGPYDLSTASAAILTYDVFLHTNTGDGLAVVFSRGDEDGDGYLDFSGFSYTGSPAAWVTGERVDLSNVPGSGANLIGESTVWVAFIFQSDSTANTTEGVYLDEVTLVQDPDIPVISSIDPSSGSAGTGTQATITGTGFGATQGTGTVDLTYNTVRGLTVEGSVVSWSDTEIVFEVPIFWDTTLMPPYPAAAGSGPVTVTNDLGGTSAGYAFEVPFAYGGIKWASPLVGYVLNANCNDPGVAEETLFDAAAATWSTESNFLFADMGASTATSYSKNGSNEVFWSETALGGSTLAAAGIWFTGTEIEEVDVAFNDTYTWGTGGGTYDVQSIALHELGHWLNLRDLYGSGDTARTMYGYGSPTAVKRSLGPGDVAGIQWIYGTDSFTLDVDATPDPALPGQDVLYTYTVSNATTSTITTVTVTSQWGLVSSEPTLAPGASFVVTESASWPTVGTKTNDVQVDGYLGGAPVQVTDTVSVDVALPALELTVSGPAGPAIWGSSAMLTYRVRNTGSFPLSDIEVTDPSAGVSLTVSGPLAPGASTNRNVSKTAGPVRSSASATGRYLTADATDAAPAVTISSYERIAGTDRIDTALQASQRAFPTPGTVDTVVVASAYAWADALPASGLAGASGGPLLLVHPTSLPAEVKAEIARLGANEVYVVGGTAVVSAAVVSALDAIPGVAVERLGGTDRFGTARLIADEMRTLPGAAMDTAFVATGRNFPDALAASSLAAAMPAPILLVEKDAVPNATAAALGALDPDRIVVCGGTGVVDAAVADALGVWGSVTRRGGADRYETARLVVEWGESVLAPSGPDGLYLAVGTNYPDALAGGVVAATANGSWYPLMLTPQDGLSSQVSSYMSSRSSVAHAGLLGGQVALSDAVLQGAKQLLP
jgi:putative cell wall-binding protein